MPEFDTTGPIDVTVVLVAGDVRITAGDRPGTTVQVRPGNPGSEVDKRFADQTVVEFTNGRLLVKGPKHPFLSLMQPVIGVFGKPGVIDVEIALATGSHIDVDGGILTLTSTGALGKSRVKSGMGDIRMARVASVDARTGSGAVSVQTVDGDATVSTGAGELRLGDVGGGAQLKTATGETRVESVGGYLRVRSSHGSVQVGRAGGDVDAATAAGDIRIGEVGPGSVTLKTAVGELQVGVPEGLPAYLDVHTSFGSVHNQLTSGGAPADGARHVRVSARTSAGDIVVRRP